jgi:hypothetical protein
MGPRAAGWYTAGSSISGMVVYCGDVSTASWIILLKIPLKFRVGGSAARVVGVEIQKYREENRSDIKMSNSPKLRWSTAYW